MFLSSPQRTWKYESDFFLAQILLTITMNGSIEVNPDPLDVKINFIYSLLGNRIRIFLFLFFFILLKFARRACAVRVTFNFQASEFREISMIYLFSFFSFIAINSPITSFSHVLIRLMRKWEIITKMSEFLTISF